MIFESLNSNLDFQNLQPSFNNNFIHSSQESHHTNTTFGDNTFGHILQERPFNENSLLNPIKELPLSGLAVYVEVMSNETNISQTCYQYLEKLGAKIEKRMNRKCNLVIWKDGSLKTIEKAKEYNVTVVNSLWLEDCTENFHLASYEKFLPELPSETDMPFLCFRNKMMKKQKSFEPSTFENLNFIVEDKENAGMIKPSTNKRRKVNFEKHSDEKKKKKGRRFDCKKNLSPLFDTSPYKTQFFSQQDTHSDSFSDIEKPLFLTQPQKTLPVVNESHLEESSKISPIKPNQHQKPQEDPKEDEAYDLKKVKNMILKYVSSYRLGSSSKKAREEPFSELQKSSAKKHLSMRASAQKEQPDNIGLEMTHEEEREEGEELNKSLSLALSKLQPLVNKNGKRSASSELSNSLTPSDTDLDEREANELQVKSNPSKKIKVAEKETVFENEPFISHEQPQIEEEIHFADFKEPAHDNDKNRSMPSSIKKRFTRSPFVEDKIESEAKSTAPKSTCSRINSVAKNLTMAIENDENVRVTDDDEEYRPITKRKKKTTRRKKLNVQKVLRELAENDESEGKAKLDELDSRDIVLLLKEMINNDLKGDDGSVHQEELYYDPHPSMIEPEPEQALPERIEEGFQEMPNNQNEGQVLTFQIQCHAFSDFDFDDEEIEEEQLAENPQAIVVESDDDNKEEIQETASVENFPQESQIPMEIQNNEPNFPAYLGDTVILSVTESQKSSLSAEISSEERVEQPILLSAPALKEAESPVGYQNDAADALILESEQSESQDFHEENMDSPSNQSAENQPEPSFEEENIENGIKENSKLLFTSLSINGMTQARQFCKQYNFQLVEEKICNIPQAEFFIYDGEDLPSTFAIVYALLNNKPLIRSDWLVFSLFKNELQDYQEYLIKFGDYPKKELFSNTLFYVDKELDKPMKSMISKQEITALVEGLGGLIVEDIINCDYYITKQPVKKRKDVPGNVKTIKPQWIIDKIVEGNRGNNPLY